jgi:hypothetical protein
MSAGRHSRPRRRAGASRTREGDGASPLVRLWRRHRVARVVLVVLVLASPIWASFGLAITNPGFGPTVGSRAAEWVREHGGASVVTWAENLWYTHHQPKIGGRPASGAIPPPTRSSTVPGGPSHLAPPQPIVPLASPPISGEGSWHAAGRLVDGVPAVYESFLRPDALHTSLVVGVAWMDTKLLAASLYSGSTIPGRGPFTHSAPIPPQRATSLDAAFNAGFLMDNANGGYFTDHRTIFPLREGAASAVIYRNGGINVGAWGTDVKMTPDVVSVRQNLDLLVDHGAPVAGLQANDISKWGYTLGNKVYVWRSGLGITRDGALVYVGGPALNITTLAALLVRAGAVRAMELDINTAWVNFTAYRPATADAAANGTNGQDLLSDMDSTPYRYFEPGWSRDFFTMSVRATAAG